MTEKQKELFYKWQELGDKIKQAATLFQNPFDEHPVTATDIIDWQQQLLNTVAELNKTVDASQTLLMENFTMNLEFKSDG